MTDRETTRLIAWAHEMRRTHAALRKALQVARETGDQHRDLLLHCRGFCSALDRHHRGEEVTLFPALEAAHPELAPVLRRLVEDHALIAKLLESLEIALDDAATGDELGSHLDGIGAIMESHFRYEERQLLDILTTLELQADVADVFGPL